MKEKEEEQEEKGESPEELSQKGVKNLVKHLAMDDDDMGIGCDKIMCARAGWCMCE